MSPSIRDRWAEFDKLGEERVRQNLADHIYGEDNTRAARAWLEHIAERRVADSQAEQADAAKAALAEASRAADAAERAAAAAERQATIAETARNIAMAALVVAIVAMFIAAFQNFPHFR